MARFRGKDVLDVAETFTHEDLMACAKAQGAEIQKNDVLIIRTGWIAKFYKVSREEFYGNFVEPGLTYSPELVQWFHDMEIPNLVTDTIANEVTVDPVSGVVLPLHNALMRNLGVTLTEIAWLDDLADDCAADGQYTFLYAAAPLKVVNATGVAGEPHRHQVIQSWVPAGRRRHPAAEGSARELRGPTLAGAVRPGHAQRHRARVRHGAGHVPRRPWPAGPTTVLLQYFDRRLTVAEVDRATDALAAGAGRPTASSRATGSPSTCRTSRSSCWPCWPRGRRAASWCRSTR